MKITEYCAWCTEMIAPWEYRRTYLLKGVNYCTCLKHSSKTKEEINELIYGDDKKLQD